MKRRALGQHFLKNKRIAEILAKTAVNEMKTHSCVHLLEIGPGKGALTEPILEILPKENVYFTLCEKDWKLASTWTMRQPSYPFLRVIEADFLDIPPNQWLRPHPIAVVSNLPYSSATAILNRLAHFADHIPVMILMFQAEVAQRLRALRGTRAWGSLSIWTQNRWDVAKLLDVPPGSFAPPPAVNSEAVVLTRRAKPRVFIPSSQEAEAKWELLLKTAFTHRRKMLRSKRSGLTKADSFHRALEASGVEGSNRAEALDWGEWEKLFQAFLKAD